MQFVPTCFNVTADFTSLLITVEPLNVTLETCNYDFDPNEGLVNNTMASLGLLAQTTATFSYASLGESLNDNWISYNQSVLDNNSPVPLKAVEASLEAVIDDIILGYGAAQQYWSNDTGQNLTVERLYDAIRLSEDGFIFATLAINGLIILIAIAEATRTQNWKRMPLLDYLDLKSVIVAVSAGGHDIAQDCHHRHGSVGTRWEGHSRSKEAAEVRVSLCPAEADIGVGPRIALAGQRANSDFQAMRHGQVVETTFMIPKGN